MSKVEGGGGGPIDPPPSRLRVTIFSRRLLWLNEVQQRNPLHIYSCYDYNDHQLYCHLVLIDRIRFIFQTKPRTKCITASTS